MQDESILRLPAVKARTGLSRSSIYLHASQGSFPKPIAIGPRAVGWLATDIQKWLQERIEASRKRDPRPALGARAVNAEAA
jgi:prophage regulatory protein